MYSAYQKTKDNHITNSSRELCEMTYDSISGCYNDWARDTGEVSRFNAINRNVVYAMPHVKFKIHEKFSEPFVWA